MKVCERIYSHFVFFVPVSWHLSSFCSMIEYTTMILEAVLHTHAWASARFKHKTQLECQKLEDQNSTILKTETEQGMCSPTPSSSTSASSFFPSFTSFHYGIIGIVGMATFAFKFCYEFYGIFAFLLELAKSSFFHRTVVLLWDKYWLLVALVTLEKMREGLASFVTKMKKALAALTGVEAWYPMLRLLIGLYVTLWTWPMLVIFCACFGPHWILFSVPWCAVVYFQKFSD